MNITLIGMPGVGKSTIGSVLAEKLDYDFIDIDDLIEERIKVKLHEFINTNGDKEFRKIEKEVILSLGKIKNCVISTGGGVVYSEESMDLLTNNSLIIFLNDNCENIRKRIDNLETRGIVGLNDDGFDSLFEKRIPLYKKYSHITINLSSERDINSNVENIVNIINNHS